MKKKVDYDRYLLLQGTYLLIYYLSYWKSRKVACGFDLYLFLLQMG